MYSKTLIHTLSNCKMCLTKCLKSHKIPLYAYKTKNMCSNIKYVYKFLKTNKKSTWGSQTAFLYLRLNTTLINCGNLLHIEYYLYILLYPRKQSIMFLYIFFNEYKISKTSIIIVACLKNKK